MKAFFNRKRIIFLAIACAALLTMIILLIFPIGTVGSSFLVYNTYYNRLERAKGSIIEYRFDTPFGRLDKGFSLILVAQTIVFTLVGIIFVVFATLFIVELARAGAFKRPHRPTKAERMQAQIDALQKQVDDLKKGE